MLNSLTSFPRPQVHLFFLTCLSPDPNHILPGFRVFGVGPCVFPVEIFGKWDMERHALVSSSAKWSSDSIHSWLSCVLTGPAGQDM